MFKLSLPPPAGGADEAIATVQITDLAKAIEKLPPDMREVISMRLEGLSREQIAEILSISRGGVDSRSLRAKARLRELLGDLDDDL